MEAHYEPLGAATVIEAAGARVRLRAGDATVEVTALGDDLIRVGFFPDGRTPAYASEAVVRPEQEAPGARVEETAGAVRLVTAEATAHIALDPLRIHLEDAEGRRFAADDPELGMGVLRTPGANVFTQPLGAPPRMHKARGEGERFFGCGERTGGLEKTGSHQVFWNVDPPEGHTASLVNLYTSIPFTLSLEDGRAHGLFVDSGHRVQIDLAKEDPGRSWYGADGGDLVSYVFTGPTPRRVLERYTELTGRMPLPPLWSLGNQQSRWSYMSADEVREVARGFREHAIPCDVLYLDIDYMDGYRVFTWDGERFPDPEGLLAELAADGFRVVCIVDPGVKADEHYDVYREGRERGFFVRNADGTEYRNAVWPGICAFPDFTDPAVREWWGDRHRGLLDAGVAGIWCDMNEPALFVPLQSTMPGDLVHPGGGDPKRHDQVHNLYGSLMARATRDGLERLRPEQRALVISRAGFAGLQRHALQWTGDNSSWWEHLWMALPQLQNLGLSGIAHCGVDVGGFFGDATPELLARFTEFGVFQPFCRNHAHMESARQEPWAFGEPWSTINREMIELRMRLLPYLYGAFEEASRTGAPVLRPLLFEHPDDPVTYTADDQLLVGDALLLAPITRPGVEHRHVYLPAGTWVQWWTGERVEGPAHVLAHAPLGRPALYARANAAVPLWPVRQHTGVPAGELTLRIAVAAGAAAATRELYEDEGEGRAHLDGGFARRTVAVEAAGGETTVALGAREGSWAPARERVVLELRGLDGAREVLVDGVPHDASAAAEGAVRVTLDESAEACTVVVRG